MCVLVVLTRSVYSLDGNWGPWNTWGLCSRTCGNAGAHIRKRLCNNPVPSPEPCPGRPCNGSDVQVQRCNRKRCPVGNFTYRTAHTNIGNQQSILLADGGWTLWSPWSTCSATCERGEQQRKRSCSSPTPSPDGETCFGPNIQARFCMLAMQCPIRMHSLDRQLFVNKSK